MEEALYSTKNGDEGRTLTQNRRQIGNRVVSCNRDAVRLLLAFVLEFYIGDPAETSKSYGREFKN
jgi:hypothetical protein